MNKEDYCKLKLEDLNITEWLGEQGVWLMKNGHSKNTPYFCTINRIDEKTLKLIETGYFRQVPVPYNYDKVKEYYMKVGYEYAREEIRNSNDKSGKVKTIL